MKNNKTKKANRIVIGLAAVAIGFGSIHAYARHQENERLYDYKTVEVYEVSRGETLWNIAEWVVNERPDYSINRVIEDIKELSGKTSSSLQIGELLVIPDYESIMQDMQEGNV